MNYYCIYCARQFLSAASLIFIMNGSNGNEQVHERGYDAIRIVAEKLEQNPDSYLAINQDYVKSRMRAETLLNGTAVCMDHLWMAEKSPGYRQ